MNIPRASFSWRARAPWLALAVLWLAWLTVPYAAAWAVGTRQGLVFAGFLHNPYDNFTYLAKMWQGYRGAWVYRLAFTEQPGPGAPLFLYYLALGHVARWTGWSLLAVYHAARLLNGLLLAGALVYAVRAWLPGRSGAQRFALLLALFGSGLGWLLFPFQPQDIPPDMGIPEAYPYLAVLTNPHFPLALALMVALLAWPWARVPGVWRWLAWMTLAAVLSVIYPFGVVVVLAALAVGGLPVWWWRRIAARVNLSLRVAWPSAWQQALGVAVGGLPYPLFALWAVRQDPTLVAWNAQNITPSPAWWIMLLAVSPALPLALYAAWEAWGRGQVPSSWQVPVWAWAVNSVVLSQIPLALQRRFFVGAFVAAALAVSAALAAQPFPLRRKVGLAVLALSLPSTGLVLAGYAILMYQGSPVLYLYPEETAAFAWIRAHTPPEAAFLTGSESGARLPAYTGRRVVIGHPMETPHATEAADFARAMLCQPGDPQAKAQRLAERGIGWVFIGPREATFCEEGPVSLPAGARLVYSNARVRIYALGP